MAKRRPALNTLPTVFVDSSVFFTAVNAPTGGSAKIFSLNNQKYKLVTSEVVLAETEHNVRKKLLSFHIDRFFMLAQQVTVLQQTPNRSLVNKAGKIIVKKDAVILAEAKQAQANYLLTLDRKHFKTKTAEAFIRPTQVVTPKELLLKTFPT